MSENIEQKLESLSEEQLHQRLGNLFYLLLDKNYKNKEEIKEEHKTIMYILFKRKNLSLDKNRYYVFD